MAQLIVRNIDEKLVQRLKLRASQHGRSAEAEHREILKAALLKGGRPERSLKELLAAIPAVGSDRDFRRSRGRGRRIRI